MIILQVVASNVHNAWHFSKRNNNNSLNYTSILIKMNVLRFKKQDVFNLDTKYFSHFLQLLSTYLTKN